MEIYDCLVHIGGDVGNSVKRDNVTVPEIEVLRRIHGHDHIVDIEKKGTLEIGNDLERENLALRYGQEIVVSTFGPYGDLPKEIESLKLSEAQMKMMPAPVTSNFGRKEAVVRS
jgi:hypothetical protein